MSSLWKTILNGAVLAIIGALTGFGFSQMTVASQVREISVKIQELDKTDVRNASMEDSRITDLREITKEIIKQNQEFIQLLKVQNELLMQRTR